MSKRALVLGGGGPVGIAWEAGLLAGLAQEGVNLAAADFIVGTSAGSFVGAQMALGKRPADLAGAIIAEAGRPRPTPAAAGDRPAPPPNLTILFQKMQEAASGERDPQVVRQEIGAFSLASRTIDEAAFIASFGRSFSDLPEDAWPDRDFACTAVDAASGEFVTWNAASKVGVVRAVASSCSVPGIYPAVTIKGRRYIDGGMRSSTNADLAAGFEKVVVVAVRSGPDDPRTARLRQNVEREVAGLRAAGAAVDFMRRPGAASAGQAQGAAMAARLKAFWDSSATAV
jgi:NTE family protein